MKIRVKNLHTISVKIRAKTTAAMTDAHFGEGDLWLAPHRESEATGVVSQTPPNYSLGEADSIQLNYHTHIKLCVILQLQPHCNRFTTAEIRKKL